MNSVLKILSESLDAPTRQALQSRTDSFIRTLKFLDERQDKTLGKVRRKGWSDADLEIIFSLNSFYQLVLGPLASSSRPEIHADIVKTRPIHYGTTLSISPNDTEAISACDHSFREITAQLGINLWWLQANRAEDVLYMITHPQHETENQEKDE